MIESTELGSWESLIYSQVGQQLWRTWISTTQDWLLKWSSGSSLVKLTFHLWCGVRIRFNCRTSNRFLRELLGVGKKIHIQYQRCSECGSSVRVRGKHADGACLSKTIGHSVYGILSQQPKETNIPSRFHDDLLTCPSILSSTNIIFLSFLSYLKFY